MDGHAHAVLRGYSLFPIIRCTRGVDSVLVKRDHAIELVPIAQLSAANALVIAVPHQVFGTGQE